MNSILIVVGAAPNTLDDFKAYSKLGFDDFDILVAGIDALKFVEPPVQYFATYHPGDLEKVQEKAFRIICNEQWQDMVDIIKPIDLRMEPSGSSALLGVLAGIDEGYKKIILCGCPLQGKNKKKQHYETFQLGWIFHKDDVKPFVRSMSGWTKEFLGEPTKEWLEE